MPERYEDSRLYRIRHSAAHIMAQALLEQIPDAKIAITATTASTTLIAHGKARWCWN